MLGPLKGRGHQFTSHQEVKGAVQVWLAAQPKTFSCEGSKKLMQWWTNSSKGIMSKSDVNISSVFVLK
jgi:hypothetical protein